MTKFKFTHRKIESVQDKVLLGIFDNVSQDEIAFSYLTKTILDFHIHYSCVFFAANKQIIPEATDFR